MVVAEIPLWVIHAGSATTEEQSKSDAEESLSLLKKQRKSAIYSLDVHPDGQSFATAGGDGTVRIWNAHSLFPQSIPSKFTEDGNYVSSSSGESSEGIHNNNEASSADETSSVQQTVHDLTSVVRRKGGNKNVPKVAIPTSPCSRKVQKYKQRRLQCTLSSHTGSSVLCVRFSTTGEYLASAGDDACVCIYGRTNNNHHQWVRTKLCRGHGLDVVDLAWAPDDSYLVSCSLDSETPIIVWKIMSNTNSMICNPFKILGKNIHTSTVKGIAFDPAGSYLASSGDDPAICIWRAHDDWGLESRIDSGIFRHWNDEDSLTQQSLFRRICWSTDGAFCVATNAVVKNKHVASTIAREGWITAANAINAAGAANLVGHKQPVVVSRHAPHLLRANRKGDEGDEDDDEPEYATLLALGDRRGFITVWSTRKSRPLFKLQCSESRCTVTDLSWGRVGKSEDLMLLVSLLDGQVVALRFTVPDEIGELLTTEEKTRVFRLRYGIADSSSRFVGRSSGPKLIENALQVTLENELEKEKEAEKEPMDTLVGSISSQQEESRTQSGKKRVRPVFVPVGGQLKTAKTVTAQSSKEKTPVDPLQEALKVAEKAVANASDRTVAQNIPDDDKSPIPTTLPRTKDDHQESITHKDAVQILIPHANERKHSLDLPLLTGDTFDPFEETTEKDVFTVDCLNTVKAPPGSKGGSMSCIEIALQQNGKLTWKDLITGTSCSAASASKHTLAVGCDDGSIQLFGTSPSLGWSCGTSFRSHPPLVLGSPIISLSLKDGEDDDGCPILDMLVVTGDGNFGVYRILPELSLHFKGSVLPAMKHMSLSSLVNDEMRLPNLSRAQLTDHDSVLLMLSFHVHGNDRRGLGERTPSKTSTQIDGGPGGALQSFVYDRKSELWLRLADSRFVLSDFYSTLPVARVAVTGPLSRLEDAVRAGSIQSSLKPSHRGSLFDRQADAIHSQLEEESSSFIPSRAHCEDRMACALAVESSSEFKHWLSLYARTLVARGMVSQVRMLVDMVLGKTTSVGGPGIRNGCWWLSSAPTILDLDRIDLVRSIVVSELSRNRALQRITNEILIELGDQ